jgi:peroxiredoxin
MAFRFDTWTLGVALLALAGSNLGGCNRSVTPEREEPKTEAAKVEAASPGAKPATAAEPTAAAALGQSAPDFELTDLDGKKHRLSDHTGKVVVLEWFNPNCPYVRASHTKGSLVDTAKKQAKEGVVWLAINSGAPGKQGHGVETNRAGKEDFGLTHPVLLDEAGKVGRLYGAERTPHLYVIDADGKLVYRGAIDNSPDGEGESPSGDKLVNYVENALIALREKKPVSPAETRAYGCSVKYGS